MMPVRKIIITNPEGGILPLAKPIFSLLGLLCLALCHNLLADTKYVTDDLQLSLYEKSGSKGKLLQKLSSGTRLEVLKEDGFYARVKTPDGTIGWTKSGFLVQEKPARALLIELQQGQSELQQELETTRDQLKVSEKLAAELRAEKIQVALELAQERENRQSESTRQKELQHEISQLRERLGVNGGTRISLSWGLIGSSVALLLGFVGGIALFDWMSRKRHGGYRVY
jgi:SH3 domain protein